MTVLTNSKKPGKKTETVIDLNGNDNANGNSPLGVLVEEGNVVSKWKSFWRLLSIVAATVIILVLSLIVGMACGRLYRHYLMSQHEACPRFSSTGCSASIPFDPAKLPIMQQELGSPKGPPFRTFRQDFEIDIESRRYVMTSVPYKGQRMATFVHDFEANVTAIVDLKSGRCFVKPLNMCQILSPDRMFNLIHQTMHGYSIADLDVLTENYHVVVPSISVTSLRSCYITEQCAGRPVYRLAKCNRDTKTDVPTGYKFAEFTGKGLVQYEIDNYRVIERFEDTLSD